MRSPSLVGEPPPQLSLEPVPLDGEPPVIPADLPSRMLERRPDVAAAERRVAAANAQIGVASAAFFPSVTLTERRASRRHGCSSGCRGRCASGRSARRWRLTLFDAGARRAAKAQAVASYDETVAAYRQTVLAAFQDVEDNLAAERLLASEDEQQQAAVAAAQRSLDDLAQPVPGRARELPPGGDAADGPPDQPARGALGHGAPIVSRGAARAGARRRMGWGLTPCSNAGRRGGPVPRACRRTPPVLEPQPIEDLLCVRSTLRRDGALGRRKPSGDWHSSGPNSLAATRDNRALSGCCCGSSDRRSCCC